MNAIFRAIPNLRSDETWTLDGGPWDYDSPRPDNLEGRKAKFRKWQMDPDTNHIQFSLIEPVNPARRIDQDNPALCMYGWVADYDADITSEEFLRRVLKSDQEIRPAWFSRTFSGGIRAVWLFEEKVWADCTTVSEKFTRNFAIRVKAATLAPNLDSASFNPFMYWELGTDWQAVPDATEVPPDITEQIFKDAVAQTKRVEGVYTDLPMDEIRAEVERRYPGRLYDSILEVGNRVPLFWLPITGDNKEKDKAAMVAEWGVYAFSSRADKGRVFWDELLGEEFVQKFREKRIHTATSGCYYDGRGYWRLDYKHDWQGSNREDTMLYLKVERGLTATKKPKESASEAEQALYAIQTLNRVDVTSPFTHTSEKFVDWNGERYLNINRKRPKNASAVGTGDPEQFPWLLSFFENFFERHPDDKFHPREHYLAELQRAYRSFVDSRPCTKHVLIVCGPTGRGKSLLNTFILREIFGSATDAGRFFVEGGGFNKEMGESAVWYVDDNQSAGSLAGHKTFSETLKKHAATPEISYTPKFHDSRVIPWYGVIAVSCNDDPDSISLIPDLDINILDKLCLFKVDPDWTAEFFETTEMQGLIRNELPYFLRWLLDDFVPSEGILTPTSPRYGMVPYHHSGLVHTARESSSHFRLSEVLDIWRRQFAEENSKNVWVGNSSALLTEMTSQDSTVSQLMRSYSVIQFGRLMNSLANQGIPWLKRDVANKSALWVIDLKDVK